MRPVRGISFRCHLVLFDRTRLAAPLAADSGEVLKVQKAAQVLSGAIREGHEGSYVSRTAQS